MSPTPTFPAAQANATKGSTTEAPDRGHAYGRGIPNLNKLLAPATGVPATGAGDADIFARWLAVDLALTNQQRRQNGSAWFGSDAGANTGKLNAAAQDFLGSTLTKGQYPHLNSEHLADNVERGAQLKLVGGGDIATM